MNDSPSHRQWQRIGRHPHHGIVVPLFSLHSKNSYGIGEYPDLILLFDWCKTLGIDVIQLLPLNDTGNDTSPYSAISAFALNPYHLGLDSLPFLQDNPELLKELATLPKPPSSLRVNYTVVRALKDSFLKKYCETAKPQIISLPDYHEFISRSHWLKDYALYKILKKRFENRCWVDWPPEWKDPEQFRLDALAIEEEEEMERCFIIQFLCDRQLHHAKIEGEKQGIFLMGDIPILINLDSVDVWRNPQLFLLNYSAGAPPDMYSEEGQDWGCPIYNWQVMASEDYKWWIDRLKTASRYYQIYRLDHIVGFFRIWSIPRGLKCKEGHFIPEDTGTWEAHGRKILEVMLKNCEMLPIGEDLGIVPPQVRGTLRELGICGTKVMRWERRWEEDGLFIPPGDYPELGLTTVSTHDSETLQQWWKKNPFESRLYSTSRGWEFHPDLDRAYHETVLKESHESGSLFHINLLQEYLALVPELSWAEPEEDRINIPGTVSDSNWSYRFRPSVEKITENQVLRAYMKGIIPA